MSTKPKQPITAVTDIGSATLPWVRKPGNVPIKSWAVPLEGSALEQATNLSNLPFAIHSTTISGTCVAVYQTSTA